MPRAMAEQISLVGPRIQRHSGQSAPVGATRRVSIPQRVFGNTRVASYTDGPMQQASSWLAAGRYEVGEVVGRGGYGMVCRGLDRKTGLPVALKMLSPEAGRDPDVVERMLREQQALVALTGTCAVTAIDLCRLESGAPCLVMEWLDGCDLEQQLSVWEAAGLRGSSKQLLDIVRAVSQTLARAHEIGIVHRDIKPANVFLVAAPTPGVRLLDFGLSRMKSAAPLTAMGMVMGSPSYIAPETWRGNSAVLDGRADLFALAVIVFRYLTGQLPFEAQDLIGKMTAVTSGPRPSVIAQRPDLPAAVDAWMTRALAVDAADRFQTGGDFLASFEAALRGETLVVSAEVSGVRAIAKPDASEARAPEDRKSALASAWRAAATLLKRFTQPRERATPDPGAPAPDATPPAPEPSLPVPTVVSAPLSETPSPTAEATAEAEPSPRSERPTIWLDSGELRDFEAEPGAPDSSPMTLRSELPPGPPTSLPAASTEVTAAQVLPTKRQRAKGQPRRRAKAHGKSAPKRGRKPKPRPARAKAAEKKPQSARKK